MFVYRLLGPASSRSISRSYSVNGVYQQGTTPQFTAEAKEKEDKKKIIESLDTLKQRVLDNHNLNEKKWSDPNRVKEIFEQNGLFTWIPSSTAAENAIHVTKGEGCYFYGADEKKYLDFNSQAMCVNLGHTVPPSVVNEINKQLNSCAYVYPGISLLEIRAKVCSLFADIFPGDINTFFFPSSGAEANEAAIRLARKFTGRSKILSRYRSYHGGSYATLSVTGDFRNHQNIHTPMPDVVHFFDPYPHSFSWGKTETEICQNSVAYLEETIKNEGSNTIAAIMIETITGTNGVLIPPDGYLKGVRELCDKYGILMICDEVMCGFGRTGKWFAFEHEPSVLPDIVTFAKGVNGAFLPLGGVGFRDHIADHFRQNSVGIGSTYNGHPVALASAYGAVMHLLENDIVQNAANMEAVMVDCMERLKRNHPSFKQGRVRGLFAAFDLQKNSKTGEYLGETHEAPSPALGKFKNALLNDGLFTMMRPHTVFCNPPLIINESQIRQGFDIIDKNLHIIDESMDD